MTTRFSQVNRITLFSAIIVAGFFLSLGPLTARAQTAFPDCESTEIQDRLEGRTRLNVPLLGFTDIIECVRRVPNTTQTSIERYNVLKDRDPTTKNDDLANYLYAFYVYFVWIVGILATVMVMYGGIQWLTAAGNSSRIENAKQTMNSAFIAVVLTLTSYLLLQLINPTLLRLRLPVTEITPQFAGGFCTQLNEIDLASAALAANKKCGDIFEYPYKEDGIDKSHFCMSSYCSNYVQACLSCSGEGKPYKTCPSAGLHCVNYDNQISVTGTIINPGNLDLYKVELFRMEENLENPNEIINWKKIGEVKGRDHFTDGSKIKFELNDSVALTHFKFDACFGNAFSCRACSWIDPSGTTKPFLFELPFTLGAPSTKDFNFNVQAILNQC